MYAAERRSLRQVLMALGLTMSASSFLLGRQSTYSFLPLILGFMCVRFIGRRRVWLLNHNDYPRALIDNFSDTECKLRFNFCKSELRHLLHVLGVPTIFRDKYRCVYTGEEAFLLLLRRLNYPSRLIDLVPEFGLKEGRLSILLDMISTFIWKRHKHLLEDVTVWVGDFPTFAAAIFEHLGTYDNLWGFIDGTLRGVARPTLGQRLAYSGHKRIHRLKYQGIALPNGLIGCLWGPILGSRHDAYMLAESGLQNTLAWLMTHLGAHYVLYGDPAYPLTPFIQTGFRGVALSGAQRDFNRTMSAGRVVVEWLFGDILSLWTFGCLRRRQQIYVTPVARYYLLSAFFTNCHTCMHGGNKISLAFNLPPPTLEQYVALRGIPGAPVTRI